MKKNILPLIILGGATYALLSGSKKSSKYDDLPPPPPEKLTPEDVARECLEAGGTMQAWVHGGTGEEYAVCALPTPGGGETLVHALEYATDGEMIFPSLTDRPADGVIHPRLERKLLDYTYRVLSDIDPDTHAVLMQISESPFIENIQILERLPSVEGGEEQMGQAYDVVMTVVHPDAQPANSGSLRATLIWHPSAAEAEFALVEHISAVGANPPPNEVNPPGPNEVTPPILQ